MVETYFNSTAAINNFLFSLKFATTSIKRGSMKAKHVFLFQSLSLLCAVSSVLSASTVIQHWSKLCTHFFSLLVHNVSNTFKRCFFCGQQNNKLVSLAEKKRVCWQSVLHWLNYFVSVFASLEFSCVWFIWSQTEVNLLKTWSQHFLSLSDWWLDR
jgi:hypothetical protein